jgi:hypothetical protein
VQIDFLYQDLFHGGREAAVRELDMLQLLSDVQHLLESNAVAAADVRAIVGPTEADDDVVRVSLVARAGEAVLGFLDKSLGRSETPASAIADIADGLATVGIHDLHVTQQFDADGRPGRTRPYSPV